MGERNSTPVCKSYDWPEFSLDSHEGLHGSLTPEEREAGDTQRRGHSSFMLPEVTPMSHAAKTENKTQSTLARRSNAPGLKDFFAAVRETNPFAANRITEPSLYDVNVPEIHAEAFDRLTGLARPSTHGPAPASHCLAVQESARVTCCRVSTGGPTNLRRAAGQEPATSICITSSPTRTDFPVTSSSTSSADSLRAVRGPCTRRRFTASSTARSARGSK